MKRPAFFLVFGLLTALTRLACSASNTLVIAPVIDLRADTSSPPRGLSDDKQQTQLLFGEAVTVGASSGAWVQVNAVEQPAYKYHKQWEGYPGWVPAASLKTGDIAPPDSIVTRKWLPVSAEKKGEPFLRLPLGSRVRVLSRGWAWSRVDLLNGQRGWAPRNGLRKLRKVRGDMQRRAILETAALLVGDPYVWGGLSPADETRQTWLSGVDCSGLVHLSYRVNGVGVPRDSLEQYWRADKIKRAVLRPADLIFSANAKNPKKISHVALYAGWNEPPHPPLSPRERAVVDGWIIEAPQTGLAVRKIPFKEKYGRDLSSVESGDTVGDRVIYFGRFLKD
jgi:cell wall-associated NlpC family hydrolase